ncbi:helix-turn-helix domain-containing protein [Rhodospirillaceae bacterium KN72]|uniref:Helix-turn-helix domain-containing protein n=1 Tax=Pacificispira spongiicola TaxID=2729598 RepID=A0A7Y0HEU9_9PROT|nr:helix-turn-helix domain-containing protein [Pacificispira spongiicola]NMM43297.1 helix-turn-helix domain-containing protein [Pacificispira spongiicola]
MKRTITGLRIRERRRELGLKQVDLAKRVGISPAYLNHIERNRRTIGGGLLVKIGRELDLSLEQLDGSAERRLHNVLVDLATDPDLGKGQVDQTSVDEFIARFPGWARLAVSAYRGLRGAKAESDRLRDRLAHDPALAEAVHAMLTEITTLRSIAEILDTTQDIEPDRQRRFQNILHDQSRQLSQTGSSLAAYFDEAVEDRRHVSAESDAEEIFYRHRTEAMTAIRKSAATLHKALSGDGRDLEDALLRTLPGLSQRPNIRDFYTLARGERIDAMLTHLLTYREPPEFSVLIDDIVDRDDAHGDVAGIAVRLREILRRTVADEIRMPLDRFAVMGEGCDWDIDTLARACDDDSGLACRRLSLAVLSGGIAAAHVEIDLSGAVLHRGGSLDLLGRIRDIECPLWPVHEAGPDRAAPVVKSVRLSDGEFRVAIAVGQRRSPRANMIVMSPETAEKTVYKAMRGAAATDVGPSCRLCAHIGCRWRREEAIVYR